MSQWFQNDNISLPFCFLAQFQACEKVDLKTNNKTDLLPYSHTLLKFRQERRNDNVGLTHLKTKIIINNKNGNNLSLFRNRMQIDVSEMYKTNQK